METIPELATRRANLEDARSEMAAQRKLEGLRRFGVRRSPKWVDPARRRPATAWGLSAIVVSALFVVGAVLWVSWRLAFITGEDDAVMVVDGSVVETLEPTDSGNCVWTLAFELEALTPRATISIHSRDSHRNQVPRAAANHHTSQLDSDRTPTRSWCWPARVRVLRLPRIDWRHRPRAFDRHLQTGPAQIAGAEARSARHRLMVGSSTR